MSRRYDVIVVGGGQAGLAIGYYLARHGADFLILDAAASTGEVWRQRWDSLTLFTPARYSSLPGRPFPGDPDRLPGKDEVADYLEAYALAFELPIRYNERVLHLEHISEWCGFAVHTAAKRYDADHVVVATGAFQNPSLPPFTHAVASHVVQLHSSSYRNPAQLPEGDVLVVGGGNSGVQIAAELARTRRTWLSVGHWVPTLPDRILHQSLFWWLENLGMMRITAASPIGRRMRRRDVLIGGGLRAAARSGVQLVGKTLDADGNVVFTSDGSALEFASIIWATGFRPDYGWIDIPVFDETGSPIHTRGMTTVTGLFFLGLPWQHTRGSALLGWVGRDAAFIAQRIAS